MLPKLKMLLSLSRRKVQLTKYSTKSKLIFPQESQYKEDHLTNVTPKILSHVGRNLHLIEHHPLSLVRQKIVDYFYKNFKNNRGNPVFSVYDNLSPIVSVKQNFDTLLVPRNHVSRAKSDCYYLNENYLLRGHTTAHQNELIQSGLDNFLIVGDVYRRDEIDRCHYPVFHQLDAVRLKNKQQLFGDTELQLFENSDFSTIVDAEGKQSCHTLETVKLMEHELKQSLSGLAKALIGEDIVYKWVETNFPFTYPSWELEVYHNNEWLELLGCGIMRQGIVHNAGVDDKIGWAFGLGLERIAMCIYQIPDIRLFWSRDSGFLNQFKHCDINTKTIYKPVSQYPQCVNDISFWLPQDESYSSNDFYDLVRAVGGDIVEQVSLIDKFTHPKTGKMSHCYKIVYRHMEKTLTQSEVNEIHSQIAENASGQLKVTIR